MGWTQVPGITTKFPPAAAFGRDDVLYMFAVGTDQYIYLNQRTGDTWSGWTRFPGTAQTKYGVGATTGLNQTVIVVHTGLDGKVYESWSDEQGGWSDWKLVGDGTGSTGNTPVVIGSGDKIAFFLTGNNAIPYTQEYEITMMTPM